MVWFASPEDVILKKLQYYLEGRSEKHIRDIAGVIRVQGDALDRTFISEWATRMNTIDAWLHILEKLETS